MAIDPSVNIAQAAQLYSQAQKTGVSPSSIPEQDPEAAQQSGFANLVSNYLDNAVQDGKHAEKLSMEGALGQANMTDVVTAVSEAEVTLQTVVAIRDKVVDAYKEILRMPI